MSASPAWFAAAGVTAGLVAVVDGVPYVRDTWRGVTRPHRGTWTIWSALAIVAFAAQLAGRGTWSLLMVGTQAVLTTIIWVLSFRRGHGAMTPVNVGLLVVAAGGVIGWLVSSDPVIATFCVIFADSVGVAMMVPKTWRDPHSETLMTFTLASLSGLLGAIAVGSINAALLLYPGYFAAMNGAIATLIWWRRRVSAAPDPSSLGTVR